ncbi:MAG: homoserine/homoserine lactone efflux protein [Pseudomonadota bacterium]
MSPSLWLTFFVASVVIAVTPGPGAVLSMASGLRYGVGRSLATILGLELALGVHIAIVATGLGALLAASALAFDIVKFIGAAYLVYLGVHKWRSAVSMEMPPQDLGQAQRSLLLQGLLVNLTNPKAIVFIAALVPQFIDPRAPQLPQYLIIAATMFAVDVPVMAAYAGLAARLRHWLHNARAMRLQNRVFGGLFVTAGVMLAGSSRT